MPDKNESTNKVDNKTNDCEQGKSSSRIVDQANVIKNKIISLYKNSSILSRSIFGATIAIGGLSIGYQQELFTSKELMRSLRHLDDDALYALAILIGLKLQRMYVSRVEKQGDIEYGYLGSRQELIDIVGQIEGATIIGEWESSVNVKFFDVRFGEVIICFVPAESQDITLDDRLYDLESNYHHLTPILALNQLKHLIPKLKSDDELFQRAQKLIKLIVMENLEQDQ